MNADTILAIPLTEPERLFSRADAIKEEFKRLALFWHPDRNADKKAAAVIAHINVLRDRAEEKAGAGVWETPGLLKLEKVTGGHVEIPFKKRHAFDLGETVYGGRCVAYILRGEFADLFHSGTETIKRLRYRDDEMKKEFSRYMPKILSTFETKDGRCVAVFEKTSDVVRLDDVRTHFGGSLPPEHVAWILNRFYNIACYLDWAGLTHNAISMEDCFISPEHHSGLLLGGWWFAAKPGARMSALPPRSRALAPADILKSKQADGRLDLTLLRAMGRELFADPSGMNLLTKKIPEPLVTFLRHPTSGNARSDYSGWGAALRKAFGPRRFVPMPFSISDFYGKD